jgi:hypothetical protein
MSRAAITLAVMLALLAIAVGLTLTRSPITVLASNGAVNQAVLVETASAVSGCQGAETLPAGTSAIRLAIGGEIGPATSVTVKSGGRILARGSRPAGWTGGTVTVPVPRPANTVKGVDVCFTLAKPLEPITIFGIPSSGAGTLRTSAAQLARGRLGIEYLHSGPSSWLSLLPTIAWRMGIGHAWPGSWIVFALLAAMLASAALLSTLALRELG